MKDSARTDRLPGGGLLARSSDLLLVLAIAGVLTLMILPLPPELLDLLIASSITASMILMMASIYIAAAVEFSVFPSLLLIVTLFRLSLSIATTRMILTEGRAGAIIDTFGSIGAGGNLVVGLVVFLIITVVQFIVIAKGAERIAEVSARFNLDALPGKQMSIDSDLRSGLLDKDEARRRRRELELESKLHGSLDGAMKFVKGDAVAGIVIVLINLIGGLAVGVLQRHLSFAEAVRTYLILTIGDGMVTQIPAILAAMAAGLIVTRATDAASEKHLADAVRRQLAAKPRALLMAGGLAAAMAAAPGFPPLAFLMLGGLCICAGVSLDPELREGLRRRLSPLGRALGREQAPVLTSAATRAPRIEAGLPLRLEIEGRGAQSLDGDALAAGLEAVLDGFERDLGLSLPPVQFSAREGEGAAVWRLYVHSVRTAGGQLAEAQAVETLCPDVREALRRNLGSFVGLQETSALLARLGATHSETVKEATRILTLMRLADVLRRLAEEEVPLKAPHLVLDALADAGQKEKDGAALAEIARTAVRRHILARCAPDGALDAVVLAPDLEQRLREALRGEGAQARLAIDPMFAKQLIDVLANRVRGSGARAILVSLDLRRHLRRLAEPELFDTPVLGFNELHSALRLNIVDRIGAPGPTLIEPREEAA